MNGAASVEMTSSERLGDLRREVRVFLERHASATRRPMTVDTWLTGWDEGFSRELAARGWVGMTVPTRYGGRDASFLERFVVTEELLAGGAPVAAHWIADRQVAPAIGRFGTEKQRTTILPAICQAERFFAIGMSEPDVGSDLASVRTTAVAVRHGWRLSGTKIWSSGAHHAHAILVLARTSPRNVEDRHAGLSQFIVDLTSPGVTIRPIHSMDGGHHFNEVLFDDVTLDDDAVLGEVGGGWRQVTAELSHERSGPERYLAAFGLLEQAVATYPSGPVTWSGAELGKVVARLAAIRHLSRGVATDLCEGRDVGPVAALVKFIGTEFEGDVIRLLDHSIDRGACGREEEALLELLHSALVQRAGFTLRGGTTEVLTTVLAKELGL